MRIRTLIAATALSSAGGCVLAHAASPARQPAWQRALRPAFGQALRQALGSALRQAPRAASPRPVDALRTMAIDERLVADRGLRLGDTLEISAVPGAAGERVLLGAIVRRGADPSEVARAEYKVRLHLGQLQRLIEYGDRVDRFAVDAGPGRTEEALASINARAFGFRAHRSSDVAVETSRTFAVVSRFNRAIGVITIVASAIFLLCIMLLKVEERRREVAALRLLGISRATVTRAVVLEASLIALLGSAAGVGFAYLSSSLINAHYRGVYRTPLAFSVVTLETVAFAVTLSLALGIGAGVLAARRLASAPPLSLFGR